MKNAPEHLIFNSVFRGNILPLTSVCNVSCIFCSHRQNPPGVETYKVPPLDRRLLADALGFVNPAAKIVIGESVTRIIVAYRWE